MSDDKLLQEYRFIFNMFDTSGDGVLNAIELGNVMRCCGQSPSQMEVQRILEEADTDNSGQIDFGEFINIMKRHHKEPDSTDDLCQAFRLIDVNGDGYVDVRELTDFLTSFGEKLTEAEVQKVVATYDTDKDGKLNYKEFLDYLTRQK